MCLHYNIGKTKTPKENLEKEKAIIGLFFGGRETIFYRCTQETTVQENIVRMKSALGPSMNLRKGHSYITYFHFLIIMDGPLLKSTCRGWGDSKRVNFCSFSLLYLCYKEGANMPEMCLRNIWMVPKTALLAAGQVSAMSGAQKNSRGFTIGYALMQSTILNLQWGQSPLEFTFATTYCLKYKKCHIWLLL